MKRAVTILAVTAAGAFAASTPARAEEMSLADRILNAVYADLGMSALADDEPITAERNGFFVGVHSGLGAESGVSPLAAGLSVPLNTDDVESITANAYYAYTTDWSLGTYVGGGFGKFNLAQDPLLNNTGVPKGNFAYQGIAGLTYSFTPSMALGLEYRYSEHVENQYLSQSTLPSDQEQNQSVTLRFDFLLN